MRSIDADALEKLFEEECAGECPICCYSNEGCPCGLIKTAPTVPNEYMRGYEAAEREYKRPTGEWVPVSERVPEIATRCIVQLSNGYITIGEYFSIAKWTLIETSLQFVYPKETVTAWMSLPQPYKEEAEND